MPDWCQPQRLKAALVLPEGDWTLKTSSRSTGKWHSQQTTRSHQKDVATQQINLLTDISPWMLRNLKKMSWKKQGKKSVWGSSDPLCWVLINGQVCSELGWTYWIWQMAVYMSFDLSSICRERRTGIQLKCSVARVGSYAMASFLWINLIFGLKENSFPNVPIYPSTLHIPWWS